MSSKNRFSLSFAGGVPKAEVRKPKPTLVENSLPAVLGGRRIQQLDLPREFLEPALKNRVGPNGKVAPSNLDEIHEMLKREFKVG